METDNLSQAPEIIIPNLKKRFSGITSTILQVLPEQSKQIHIRVLGYKLDTPCKPIRFWELFKLSAKKHPNGYPIIYHARRNDDMIVGLLLKKVFKRKLHLIFTSVAQRHHTTFTKFLYRRMDTLLSTSDRSASYLERKPDRIIPHGTDIERYRPASDRTKSWKDSELPGKYGIGVFGRVRENKGIGDFVRALCQVLPNHQDYTAVICGEVLPKDQSFVDQLKQEIEDKGLSHRFVWLGKRPFSELPEWFRRMSLVAAVSHTEGFGLTCLEAMASGAPMVATQAGGFEMVVREGIDGHIVPIQNIEKLTEAFEKLLGNPEKLIEMGKNARERIEDKFTVQREAGELVEVYRSIQNSYLHQ